MSSFFRHAKGYPGILAQSSSPHGDSSHLHTVSIHFTCSACISGSFNGPAKVIGSETHNEDDRQSSHTTLLKRADLS